jgi:peptide methionine sulfoxide reductase MsrB
MTGQGGEPMSRRATLLALTVPYVLAYTASPVLAYAGEGTMSKAEVVEAASKLTARQKAISLEAATEQPFTGKFVNDYPYSNEQEGTYVGAISGAPLFESSAKYDSKTGWPSFTSPIPGAVIERKDPEDLAKTWEQEDNANNNPLAARPKNGDIRTEVIDAVSGAHLGHVFDDGPSPGGKRYCMNAGAMAFIPKVDREREKLKRLMNVDPAQELQGVAGKGVKTKITAGSGKFAGGR